MTHLAATYIFPTSHKETITNNNQAGTSAMSAAAGTGTFILYNLRMLGWRRSHVLHAVGIGPLTMRPRKDRVLFPSEQFLITDCQPAGSKQEGSSEIKPVLPNSIE